MPFKQDKTLTLIHNDLAEGAGPILRKGMSATSRKDYTGVFEASTIYMLEKVVECHVSKSSQVTTIQIWEERRMPRNCKKLFHAKSPK